MITNLPEMNTPINWPDTYSEDKTQSRSIKELATALSKAQSEIHAAEKDSTNPFFKNSYASLTSVWEAARGPLTKNGLAVIQTTAYKYNFMFLITTLVHNSGEWIRGEYLLNPTKNDPQGLGASTTYARRYSLSAMIGITTEDDDGERAIDRTPTPQRPAPGTVTTYGNNPPRQNTKVSF